MTAGLFSEGTRVIIFGHLTEDVNPFMRLWTVHPQYLDSKGLVALWRESLLAQKVLQGETSGYRNHPQLYRFKCQPDPLQAIGTFLLAIAETAATRNYSFNKNKILYPVTIHPIKETRGQLLYEWQHLLNKLQQRNPIWYQQYQLIPEPLAHPLFVIIPGDIQPWEIRKA